MPRLPASARAAIALEVESALAVAATQPAAVVRRLERLRGIGDWLLVPRPTELIEDDYFDSSDSRLAEAKIALRMRRLNGTPRLALKGPARKGRSVALARPELDVPWSTAAASRALRALAEMGVPLARRTASRAWRGPDDFVAALDLRLVQRRSTRREPRDVMEKQAPRGPALAELAVDTIAWRIGQRRVRLAEVEVEAKRPEGREVANHLPALLLEEFRDALKPWRPSKLATGLALEALEREGRLAALLSPGGWLTAKGLDAVARRIRPGASR